MRKRAFLFFLSILLVVAFPSFAGPAEDLENAFVSVSEEAGKAVVTVQSTKMMVQKFAGSPFRDPFFDEFFKDFFGDSPSRERQFQMQGLGSGFIINKDGYIMTNEHVVEDASEIEVILSDGRRFAAVLVGADKRSDVAVLKIEGDDIPFVKLGDSGTIKTGQWVIAIGNPFGNIVNNPDPTVTVGVVSALHRSLDLGQQDGRFYRNLIQTDAAINRGNSGGPLLNLKGEVVGINSLIFSTTGGNQGIGFALPINHAKRIFENIVEGKEIVYPWIGIWIQPLTRDIIKQFQLDSNRVGALVFKVQPDSPAERSGIRQGDIILRLGGKDIRNPQDLINAVSSFEVGETIIIELVRNGKALEVEAQIGARPSDAVLSSGQSPSRPQEEQLTSWRGMTVRDINDEDRNRLGRSDVSGVIIDNVQPGSAAHLSGLQAGMVIDEINRGPVLSREEFLKTTGTLKGKILIHTDSGFFVVDEPKDKKDNKEKHGEEK